MRLNLQSRPQSQPDVWLIVEVPGTVKSGTVEPPPPHATPVEYNAIQVKYNATKREYNAAQGEWNIPLVECNGMQRNTSATRNTSERSGIQHKKGECNTSGIQFSCRSGKL